MENNTFNDFAPLELDNLWDEFAPPIQLDQLLSFDDGNSNNTPNIDDGQYASSSVAGHLTSHANFDQFWGQDTSSSNLQLFGYDEATTSGNMAAPPIPDRINDGNVSQESASNNAMVLSGNTTRGTERIMLNGRPRRTRKPKTKAPPHSDWLRHKSTIRDLYLKQDKTLDETRKVMKDDYAFDATPNLYKQKFQEWEWVKNIPQHWTPKLARLAEDRQPKDTVFQLGPRKWTADEIMRKRERANPSNQEDSPVLPSEMIIRTPSLASPQLPVHVLVSPSRRQSQSSLAQFLNRRGSTRLYSPTPPSLLNRPWTPHNYPSFGSSARPWTPYNLPPLDSVGHPWSASENARGHIGATSHPLHAFRVNGKSITDLREKKIYAKELASQGQVKKAVDSLEEVLQGFRNLLPPAHESTMETAYELAELLRQDDRMTEADAILNWIGENHVRKFGLGHEKTLKHFAKVFALLRSWSREGDATLLFYKMVDIMKSSDRKSTSTPTLPGATVEAGLPGSIIDNDMDAIFGKLRESGQVDAQLQLVELLAKSHPESNTKLEDVLRNVISFCKERPVDDAIRLTKARYWLAKLYFDTGRDQEAYRTLKIAVELLEKHINNTSETTLSMNLLGEARKLAFLYPDRSKCNEILEILADHLEERSGFRSKNDDRLLIGFLTQIGISWQNECWDLAAPWFERALGICLRSLGDRDAKTIKLEETLERQKYGEGYHDIINDVLSSFEY